MSTKTVLDAWRQLAPSGVRISAGPLLKHAPPLTKRERESAGVVDPVRLIELENGRAYAKRALSDLGIPNVELPVGPDRSPLWPTGVVGSLAHTGGLDGGHFAALAARTDLVQAIGIDAEIDAVLAPHVWRQFLTKREFAWIESLPSGTRANAALTAWCVKEAVVKAMKRLIEPTTIEIEQKMSSSGTAKTWRALILDESSAQSFDARTICSSGLVLAAVVVLQAPKIKAKGVPISPVSRAKA